MKFGVNYREVQDVKSLIVEVDNDTYNYLEFLKRFVTTFYLYEHSRYDKSKKITADIFS